jgi:quercetin dioxygenase-like cupin family protein
MRFRVGDEERELAPGATWCIPSNVPHSAVAGPDGATVIDVFAPVRDDWAQIPHGDPRPGRWP